MKFFFMVGISGVRSPEQAAALEHALEDIGGPFKRPPYNLEFTVDVLDSPDHAHSSYILRSGWPAHGAPAFPTVCGHCGAVISTVEQAVGHRCGRPKSARWGLNAFRDWVRREPLDVVVFGLLMFVCGFAACKLLKP